MNMKSVIIGAGTYGEVYLAYLQEAGIEIVGFLDDRFVVFLCWGNWIFFYV